MKKWKCTVCGQVFEGEHPPVPCPVCGAGEEAFELLEDTAPSSWRCTVCGQIFEGTEPPVPCPVCGAGREAFEQLKLEQTDFKNDTGDQFVIVGGGVAALEAAKAIRKRNQTASITILGEEQHPPYNRPALSEVIADGLSFANLLLEEQDFYTEKNIDLRTGAKVQAINTGEKTVVLEDGTAVSYTKLLLATGSNPFNPIQEEFGCIPVRSVRHYEDAIEIADAAQGKRVVLVGGGILGLEAAIALRERESIVTIVELADRILPIQADEATSALLCSKLEALGITVMTGCSVKSAIPNGVVLSNGSEMAADMVVASLGVRSEVSLAVPTGIELSRGIVVNEYMKTSHRDIWAAGDCAEYEGKVVAMVGAASAMGAVAGASMAGDESVTYKPFIPATALNFSGFSMFSVGLISEDADETVTDKNRFSGDYKRLFFKQGKLAGALFVGRSPGAKAVTALTSGASFLKSLELLG